MANPFPLNIPFKVNSPELLAFFQQFGIDKYLSAEEINEMVQALNYLYNTANGTEINRVVTYGEVFRIGETNVFTYDIGFTGYIMQILYGNLVAFNITIDPAADGFYRGDSVVLNPDRDILIVKGEENDTNYVFPQLPEDVLEIGRHYVFGATISEPELPNNGDEFMRKQIGTFAAASLEEVANYKFTENKRHLVITGELDGVMQGLSANPNAVLSPKMLHTIENRSGVPFPLKNNGVGSSFKYFFPNAKDYIVEPNEIVAFWLDTVLSKNFIFAGSNLKTIKVPGLSEILKSGDRIVENFTGELNDDAPANFYANNYGDEVVIDDSKFKVGQEILMHCYFDGNLEIYSANDTVILINDEGDATVEYPFTYLLTDSMTVISLRKIAEAVWLLVPQVTHPVNTNDLEPYAKKVVNVFSDLTAEINRTYLVTVPCVLNDPPGMSYGVYTIIIRSGNVRIGGIFEKTYYDEGLEIQRVCYSGQWRTYLRYDDASQIDNIVRNILDLGLLWQIPSTSGAYGTTANTGQYLRITSVPATENSITSMPFGACVGAFQTTAIAGTSAGIRRNDAINLNDFSNCVAIRDFVVDNNISNDCRYVVGFSKNYQFSFPTNAEPNTFTQCILVGKLSTSNNLHLIYNDNTGIATTINLGSNFPANSSVYKFRMLLRKVSITEYYVKVIRAHLTTGELFTSNEYKIDSDTPTSGGFLQQFMWINNNASAVNMMLGDYGLIIKKN